MAVPIILNPAARSSRAGSLEKRIRALQPAAEVYLTRDSGDAEKLAFDLAAQGHKIVVAAGGDGTVNEVIHGIAQHNLTVADTGQHTVLGVVPAGTMNVLAYEMKLPGRDIEACWEIIHLGQSREIDLWQANGNLFAQLAGVGLDAEIVQATSSEMKKRFGPMSYAMSAASVLSREAPMLAVHLEGRPPLYGSVVLVGNGSHYGGPVPVFSNAKNDDGLLDVIVFHQRRPLEAFQFLKAVTSGDFSECEDVDYLQTAAFRVESEEVVPFEIDGELGKVTPVEFRLAPFKLKIAC
jgi:YegS/Rv2252/BmrU family lipid kinase